MNFRYLIITDKLEIIGLEKDTLLYPIMNDRYKYKGEEYSLINLRHQYSNYFKYQIQDELTKEWKDYE